MTDRSIEENDGGPNGTAEQSLPSGPWILVVGMHRSGTSAVAGAIGALGGMSMSRPEDRIRPSSSNPEHWESNTIMLYNEDILDRLGGSWDTPPDLEPGWVDDQRLAGVPEPGPVFADVYPEPGPLVWKDPRLCLLLPYWRLRIPEPVAAVFVWRSPLAVARSLEDRNGFPVTDGLSLWERYNRQALVGLRAMDVFALDYDALIRDPRGMVGAVADWLGSLEQFAACARLWDPDRASSLVAAEHRHQTVGSAVDGLLLAAQRSLARTLSDLDGGYRTFDAGPLPEESPWTKQILASRREASLAVRRESELWERLAERARRVEVVEGELATVQHESVQELTLMRSRLELTQQQRQSTVAELERTSRIVTNMRASTSWRITRPLRFLAACGHRALSRGRQTR